MYYIDKPIVIEHSLRPRNLFTIQPYVIKDSAGNTIYNGHIFCPSVNVKVDITNVLKTFLWDGFLKPVYIPTEQAFKPEIGVSYIDDYGNEFLQQKIQLLIDNGNYKINVCGAYNNPTRNALNCVDYYAENSTIQNYLYSNVSTKVVPRYPNVYTNNYFVSGVVGCDSLYLDSFDSFYLTTNRLHNYPIQTTHHSNYFNIPLSSILNTLPLISEQDVEPTPINYTNQNSLIGGGYYVNDTNASAIITGGTSGLTPTTFFIGGTAGDVYPIVDNNGNAQTRTFHTDEYTIYLANDNYVNDAQSGQFKQTFAKIDKCNSPFYLLWQDGNNGAFSWGFDGFDTYTFNQTTTSRDGWYLETITQMKNKTTYKLNTGLLTRDEYTTIMGILQSKYIYLYDVANDKGEYVKLKTSNINYNLNKYEPRNITIEVESTFIN